MGELRSRFVEVSVLSTLVDACLSLLVYAAAALCLYWPSCLEYWGMNLIVDANERRDAALGEVVEIGATVKESKSM